MFRCNARTNHENVRLCKFNVLISAIKLLEKLPLKYVRVKLNPGKLYKKPYKIKGFEHVVYAIMCNGRALSIVKMALTGTSVTVSAKRCLHGNI